MFCDSNTSELIEDTEHEGTSVDTEPPGRWLLFMLLYGKQSSLGTEARDIRDRSTRGDKLFFKCCR